MLVSAERAWGGGVTRGGGSDVPILSFLLLKRGVVVVLRWSAEEGEQVEAEEEDEDEEEDDEEQDKEEEEEDEDEEEDDEEQDEEEEEEEEQNHLVQAVTPSLNGAQRNLFTLFPTGPETHLANTVVILVLLLFYRISGGAFRRPRTSEKLRKSRIY